MTWTAVGSFLVSKKAKRYISLKTISWSIREESKCLSICTPIPRRKMSSLMVVMISLILTPLDSFLTCYPNCPQMIFFFSSVASLKSTNGKTIVVGRRTKRELLEFSCMTLWKFPTFLQYRTLTVLLRIACFIMINPLTRSSVLIFSRLSHCISLRNSKKTHGLKPVTLWKSRRIKLIDFLIRVECKYLLTTLILIFNWRLR